MQTEKLAGAMQWWDSEVDPARVREAGFEQVRVVRSLRMPSRVLVTGRAP